MSQHRHVDSSIAGCTTHTRTLDMLDNMVYTHIESPYVTTVDHWEDGDNPGVHAHVKLPLNFKCLITAHEEELCQMIDEKLTDIGHELRHVLVIV